MAISPAALWYLNAGSINATWDYGLLRCVYGFSAGVIVWNLVDLFGRGGRFVAARWASALEIASVAAVISFIILADTLSKLLAPLVFAAAVLVFTSDRGIVSRILATRGFALLGTWSYSIYMVHLLTRDIGFGIARLFDKLGVGVLTRDGGETLLGIDRFQGNALLALYMIIVLSVAAITYTYIEVPGRNFGRMKDGQPVARRLASNT